MARSFLVILASAILLSGCSGEVKFENPNYQGDSNPSVSSSTDSSNESSSMEATTVTGLVGQTFALENLEITLNSVRYEKGAKYFEPEHDYFLICNFTLKSKSKESVSVSSMSNFELQGSDLYLYPLSLMAETKGPLDGTISAGNSLRGEIAFDVPTLPSYELRFKEDIFGEFNLTYEIVSEKDL
jgi:hypothetical protein